jgi:hypothetical protein
MTCFSLLVKAETIILSLGCFFLRRTSRLYLEGRGSLASFKMDSIEMNVSFIRFLALLRLLQYLVYSCYV